MDPINLKQRPDCCKKACASTDVLSGAKRRLAAVRRRFWPLEAPKLPETCTTSQEWPKECVDPMNYAKIERKAIRTPALSNHGIKLS